MIEFKQSGYTLTLGSTKPVQFSRDAPVQVTLSDDTFTSADDLSLNFIPADGRSHTPARVPLTESGTEGVYTGTIGKAALLRHGLILVALGGIVTSTGQVITSAATRVQVYQSVDPEAVPIPDSESLVGLISAAVDDYAGEHGITTGATAEEVQRIENLETQEVNTRAVVTQHTEDISQLSEEITEFKSDLVDVENAIFVVGTKNLYDKDNSTDMMLSPNKSTGKLVSSTVISCVVVEIEPNKEITIEKISSKRFNVTTTTEYPKVGTVYNSYVGNGASTFKYTFTTGVNDRYLILGIHHATSDTLSFDDIKNSLKVYYGTSWTDTQDKIDNNKSSIEAIKESVESKLTKDNYIFGAMSYRPLGALSKGYICLSCDDGAEALGSYTIPMLKDKNVPCTFALYSNSAMLYSEEKRSAVKEMVSNYGCSVAMHGTSSWTDYTESELLDFIDSEDEKYNEMGISAFGAVCPNHDYNDMVCSVMGGRKNVVCTGGVTSNRKFKYAGYCSGERSNIFSLYRISVTGSTLDNLKSYIDTAIDNKWLLLPFWHDVNIADDTSQQEKLEAMIDYAKEKGITFVTVGDIPTLI